MREKRKKRGTEVLRCGVRTPSDRLRGHREDSVALLFLHAGGDLALRPTASQFIAAFLTAAFLTAAFSFPTLLFGMRPLA